MPAKKTVQRAPARRRRAPKKRSSLDQRALLAGMYLAPGVAQRMRSWPVIGQLIKQHGALGLAGTLVLAAQLIPKHRSALQGAGIGALISATQPAVSQALAEMGAAPMLPELGESNTDEGVSALEELGPEPALAGELGKADPEME